MSRICTIIIICGVLGFASAAEERTLTLEEAFQLTSGHSLSLMQSRFTAANASDDVWSAAGNMLPSIGVTGSRTRNWSSARTSTTSIPGYGSVTTSSGGRSDSYSLSANANQTIFAGGSLARTYIAARANAESNKVAYWAAKQDYLISTMQLYFGLLAAREAQESARLAAVAAKNHERLTMRQYELRSATESDKLSAETKARQAELTALEADNSAEIASANLCRALGLPLDTRLDLKFDFPSLDNLPEESVCISRAEQNRPEVAQACANLAAARNSKWAAFGGFLPKVAASASYNWSDSESFGENPWDEHDSHSVGLNFSWDIFDGFATPTSFSKKGRSASLAEETNNQVLEDTHLQVHTAYITLTNSKRKLELATAARNSAEAALKLVERTYELGGTSLLELSDAQATALQAQVEQINAKYDLLINWAKLWRQMGELTVDGLWK